MIKMDREFDENHFNKILFPFKYSSFGRNWEFEQKMNAHLAGWISVNHFRLWLWFRYNLNPQTMLIEIQQFPDDMSLKSIDTMMYTMFAMYLLW